MDRVTKTKVYIFEHQGVQELNTKIPEFYGSALEAIPVLKTRKEISNENGEKITKVIFRRVDIHKENFKNSKFFFDFKNDQAYTHKKLREYFSSRKDLDEKELMKRIKQQIYFNKGPKTKENRDKLKVLIDEKKSILENEQEFTQELNFLKLKVKGMNDSLGKKQDIEKIKNEIVQLEKSLIKMTISKIRLNKKLD